MIFIKSFYFLQCNGDRVYAIRFEDGINKKITIKKQFVDTFLEWNHLKLSIKTCKYDVKFVRLVALLVVGWANLSELIQLRRNLSKACMPFVLATIYCAFYNWTQLLTSVLKKAERRPIR